MGYTTRSQTQAINAANILLQISASSPPAFEFTIEPDVPGTSDSVPEGAANDVSEVRHATQAAILDRKGNNTPANTRSRGEKGGGD